MKVTVVIPLYNKQDYVERTIQSLLSQNHELWDAIVVNDGSTDTGPSRVEAFADPRIRLIHQINQGVSAARNLGIAQSTTEWIAFLDADDEYSPNFLSILIQFIEENADSNIIMVSTNQKYPGDNNYVLPNEVQTGIQDYFSLCTGNVTPVHSSNCIIRRDALVKSSGFPTHMKAFEDWTCWMKIAMLGKYAVVNKVLSTYSPDDPSRTSAKSSPYNDIFADIQNLLNEGELLLTNSNYSDASRKALASYLNRFIFRSAIPALCRLGGGLGSMKPILNYRVQGFQFSDLRHFVETIKWTLMSEVNNARKKFRSVLAKSTNTN